MFIGAGEFAATELLPDFTRLVGVSLARSAYALGGGGRLASPRSGDGKRIVSKGARYRCVIDMNTRRA